MTDESLRLGDEQVARFYREGFLVLDAITTPDDLALIRELLDALFARAHELPKDMVVDLGDIKHHTGKQKIPQINMASTYEPRLKETRYHRNAQSIARQLIGPDVVLRWEHTIYKPPHNQKETPWHQDLAYPVRGSGNPRMIQFGCNFWLPLQDTSIEMGCMQFIPSSNLGNLREHYPVGHNPDVHTLMTDDVDPKLAVPCPLRAGGVTIHQPKTMHYTGPNNTDATRRAYILFFGMPSMPTG